MQITELFLLLVRWLHMISAVVWIGGSIFYLAVLRPSLKNETNANERISSSASREFKTLVDTSIFVLLTTGVIMTAGRLAPGEIDELYVLILAIKIVLSVWMFSIAWKRRSIILGRLGKEKAEDISVISQIYRMLTGFTSLIVLGLAVFLLSDLLKILYEISLKS